VKSYPELDAARGILSGLLIGAAMWLMVIAGLAVAFFGKR
jgi:hypothetical protein